jgi:hypothetical protein
MMAGPTALAVGRSFQNHPDWRPDDVMQLLPTRR